MIYYTNCGTFFTKHYTIFGPGTAAIIDEGSDGKEEVAKGAVVWKWAAARRRQWIRGDGEKGGGGEREGGGENGDNGYNGYNCGWDSC